ncbi:TPA: septum formation initiator [Candidatus Latescibacteria bacterium]|nr:septum formation initiator [Candidatus Latescibacterota bacterium]
MLKVKITPLDIRKQSFKKAFRGIDPEEVQAFLEMIAEEFERLNRENLEMKERERTLDSEVKRYRDLEETLQETLRTAQKAADNVHENAKKEARLIIKEADIRGNRAIEKARNHVQMIRNEIVELKNQRDQFATRLGALIQLQQDYLTQLEFSDPPVVEELVDEYDANGSSGADEDSIPEESTD